MWTKLFCASGPNLVILASTDGELWRGQTQNGGKFGGQGRSPQKTIGIFSTYGLNLVILAWKVAELSCSQVRYRDTDRQKDTHTGAGNGNTRRPNWPRSKWWRRSYGTYLIYLAVCVTVLVAEQSTLWMPYARLHSRITHKKIPKW